MTPIDIVCPVYKGLKFLPNLINSIKKQKNVEVNNIVFAITNDGEEETKNIISYAEENNIICFVVEKDEFSHSLTREKAIKEYCQSKVVVMLSQDIELTNEFVLDNLTKTIISGETVYNYSRQVCPKRNIEKYIRLKNYPKESYIVSKEDIDKMQLMAFFASDACSAYDRDVFIKVGGYGGYDVMMNEDQLYSKIILEAGYKKKYCADSVVIHYHKYKLKQLYKRYYDTGRFYASTKIFENYKSTNTGFKLALYVFGQALIHFNIPVLFVWLPNMAARYLGMKKGKKSIK